jgi:SAM-dependent methyltransferase
LKTHPDIDQEFKYASSFLKKALAYCSAEPPDSIALDIPCGNGRNSFLLARHFKRVLGVDIDKTYLAAIERSKSQYPNGENVKTTHLDILTSEITRIGECGLICNVHFYNGGLIKTLLASMKKGAYLLVETPGCHGDNFKIIPNQKEIDVLFKDRDIVLKEFSPCKSDRNVEQRGSLKILVKC